MVFILRDGLAVRAPNRARPAVPAVARGLGVLRRVWRGAGGRLPARRSSRCGNMATLWRFWRTGAGGACGVDGLGAGLRPPGHHPLPGVRRPCFKSCFPTPRDRSRGQGDERGAEAESSASWQRAPLSRHTPHKAFPEIVKSTCKVEFGNWKFRGGGRRGDGVLAAQFFFLDREPP